MTEDAPTFLGSVMKAIACTPNLNFDPESYERGVVEPTRALRRMEDELGEGEVDERRAREVVERLSGILEAKALPPQERGEWLREVVAAHPLKDRLTDLVPAATAEDIDEAAELRAEALRRKAAFQPVA